MTKKVGEKIEYKNSVFDPNIKRNVVDHLKWLGDLEITEAIDKQKNNFSLLLVNIDYDNNTGNIIRSANAFGAKEVILYGRKKFDRRASVGTEFYSHFRNLRFLEDLDDLFKEFELIVGLENIENSQPISAYQWDNNKNTLICIGQEGNGLPSNIIEKCDVLLEIPMQGSVRSLNVSSAAAICMYDYCLKTLTESK
jgi:tRNA G18 (ribose-2'-O)-methylase SpoU